MEMDQFEKLYRRDEYHIKRWEKNYSNEEFYEINRKIRKELENLSITKKRLTPRQNFICAIIYHHGFNMNVLKKH